MKSFHFARFLCAFVALVSVGAGQTTVYVDDDAAGGDGSSWVQAFSTLQAGLTAASGIGGAVEIRVAQGTYTPDTTGLADPREATFQLRNNVSILGGFVGLSAPAADARDPDAFVTTLSGDLNGDDESGGSNTENCYHVVTGNNTDATAVLDGFTITAGNANGPITRHGEYPRDWGGGMLNIAGSPTVRQCLFIKNHANAHGGGMRNSSGSSPIVDNCVFAENSANNGGGMYNWGSSSPTVTNCRFQENVAGDSGGGMINRNNSHPKIENCIFQNNTAGGAFGGSTHGGGGIFCRDNSNAIVNSCVFLSNSALNGGGLYSFGDSVIVTNCIFFANFATGVDPFGNGAGMFNTGNGSSVSNCTFAANVGNTSSGIYFGSRTPTITNCIVWGNSGIEMRGIVNPNVSYCNVQGGYPGEGNIDADPLFVDGASGDLRFQSGSPCIDAGDNDAVLADVSDLDGDGDVTEPIPFDLDGGPRFIDDLGVADTGNSSAVGPAIVDMGAFEHPSDLDRDGIPDEQDACPNSATDDTIVINDCDTGVTNALFDDGCTMADLVAGCLEDPRNHGAFVSCTAHLLNGWKTGGLITGREEGKIQRCAAPADLDFDGDVDGKDFLAFSNCFNGSLNPPSPDCRDFAADVDDDGDVDGDDFLTFSNCFNGSLNPPACP